MGWQEKAQKLIDERDAQLQVHKEWLLDEATLKSAIAANNILPTIESCGILTAKELEITAFENDATTLLERLASGELTAVQVTTAFCKRTAITQQLTNCLVAFFPDVALETAKELDAYFAKHKKPIGPLHGLPISIKGHLAVKGHDTGAGCSILGWAGKHVAKEDAPWINVLRNSGAVFYARTTIPQAIMHLECESFWGQTLNPLNLTTSPGGSSGGEAALLAAGASPLGLGGDIGGSLRGPASYSGLYTLKTTNYRIQKKGATNSVFSNEAIISSNGALCRSLRDVDLFHKVLLDSKPWEREHIVFKMPWRMDQDFGWSGKDGKIKVGYYTDDGNVRPVPSMVRAIESVVAPLKKDSRFEVVPYEPYRVEEAVSLAHSLYFPDGGEAVRSAAAESGEPIFPLTEWILSRPSVKKFSIHEYWHQIDYRDNFRNDNLKHWMDAGIDVLLCPPTPGPAAKLRSTKYWGYTNLWNMLDYPGVVFNTGLVVDSSKDAEYSGPNEYRNDTERHVHETYKETQAEGLPLCVQLIGTRFNDEKTLTAAMEIEKCFKGRR